MAAQRVEVGIVLQPLRVPEAVLDCLLQDRDHLVGPSLLGRSAFDIDRLELKSITCLVNAQSATNHPDGPGFERSRPFVRSRAFGGDLERAARADRLRLPEHFAMEAYVVQRDGLAGRCECFAAGDMRSVSAARARQLASPFLPWRVVRCAGIFSRTLADVGKRAGCHMVTLRWNGSPAALSRCAHEPLSLLSSRGGSGVWTC